MAAFDLNLISMRMDGHASASGYDRVLEFLPGNVIRNPADLTISQRALLRCLRFLIRRSGSRWYQRNSLYSELRAGFRFLTKKRQIFHFLYGENSYRYFGLLKHFGQRNKIVSTYHIPPEAFSQIVRHTDHLKYLDAIIVVSSVQQDLFGDLIGPERVFFIPHGIDEKFFVPPAHGKSGPSETFKCIFVGTHMRDFETLSETAKILQDSKKEVRFTVITSPEFFHHFDGLSNISLFSGVSDQQLVKLYQESDLFVMPVKSCTANNSLLEAMSCGLPVVSNDLQAIRDYVDEECAVLTPQADAPALATAVNTLMDDRERLDRMAAASRKNCLRFRWEKIASRHLEVYEHMSKLA